MSGTLLLADWGTTSRRAWLLDPAGQVVASIDDRFGMSAVESGGWEAAFADLKRRLGNAEPRLSLLAGMVGSKRGWHEAPYLSCPAGLDDLARGLSWVEPGAVAIVPGLSLVDEDSADVMRGEETQVLGAVAAGLVPADCVACQPGTHSKWILVRAGRVTQFRTLMTGELFALLQAHSILAEQVSGEVTADKDFDAGVDRGFARGELTADLFGPRSHALLETGRIGNGAAYLSGLLIGAELRAGLALAGNRAVEVIGRGDLARLYVAAIGRCGGRARPIDGEAAVLAGLRKLAGSIA